MTGRCWFLLALLAVFYYSHFFYNLINSTWYIQYGSVLSENLNISRPVKVIYKPCGGEKNSVQFKGEPDLMLSLTERWALFPLVDLSTTCPAHVPVLCGNGRLVSLKALKPTHFLRASFFTRLFHWLCCWRLSYIQKHNEYTKKPK